MEQLKKRAANLVSVKSIVTLILTGVFSYMAIVGKISQDFMTIYAVIIAFYFGTQSQKVQEAIDGRETPHPSPAATPSPQGEGEKEGNGDDE